MIEYKKGRENKAVDGLSKQPETSEKGSLVDIRVMDPMWLQQLRDSYRIDPEFLKLCQGLQQG